jgi:hypothetical protein
MQESSPLAQQGKNVANVPSARIERKSGLEPSSALNQINNQDDDRNYEPFFELYRRKTLAAARRSLAIVSALVG